MVLLQAGGLAALIFDQSLPGDLPAVRLAAAIIGLDAINTLPFSFLRAERRPCYYLAGALLSAGIYAGLTIYLLSARGMGVEGVLLANLAGSAAVTLFYLPVWLGNIRARFDWGLFRIYFAFGFPIVFAGIGKSLLDLASRPIMERLMDAAAVGVFSASYRLAAVANIAVSAFALAWKPFLVRASREQDHPSALFARVMTLTVLALCLIFLAVSLFADNLVRLKIPFTGFRLLEPSYWPGLVVIPPVLAAYIFYGVYLNLTVGCDLTGKTYYYAWTTLAAAVVNIAACFLLIPPLGMMGAAWATLLSYGIEALVLFLLTRRIYPIAYQWGRLLRLVLLAAACFVSAKLAGDVILVELLAIAGFVVLLFPLRIIDRSVLQVLSRAGRRGGQPIPRPGAKS